MDLIFFNDSLRLVVSQDFDKYHIVTVLFVFEIYYHKIVISFKLIYVTIFFKDECPKYFNILKIFVLFT